MAATLYIRPPARPPAGLHSPAWHGQFSCRHQIHSPPCTHIPLCTSLTTLWMVFNDALYSWFQHNSQSTRIVCTPQEAGWSMASFARSAELLKYTWPGWDAAAVEGPFIAWVNRVMMPALTHESLQVMQAGQPARTSMLIALPSSRIASPWGTPGRAGPYSRQGRQRIGLETSRVPNTAPHIVEQHRSIMLLGNRTGSKVSAGLVTLRTANELACRTCFTCPTACYAAAAIGQLANDGRRWVGAALGPAAGLGFGRHTCQQPSLASLDRPCQAGMRPACMPWLVPCSSQQSQHVLCGQSVVLCACRGEGCTGHTDRQQGPVE
jgi:hypothetical protein